MKKIIMASLLAFTFFSGVSAQDKGTIPPSADKITEDSALVVKVVQKISLQSKVKHFLHVVTEQKRICKNDIDAPKETNFIALYNYFLILDRPYRTPPAINQECLECEGTQLVLPKHHPTIECIFKNVEVQKNLKEVIDHQAFRYVITKKGKDEELFIEITDYYRELLKEYERKN